MDDQESLLPQPQNITETQINVQRYVRAYELAGGSTNNPNELERLEQRSLLENLKNFASNDAEQIAIYDALVSNYKTKNHPPGAKMDGQGAAVADLPKGREQVKRYKHCVSDIQLLIPICRDIAMKEEQAVALAGLEKNEEQVAFYKEYKVQRQKLNPLSQPTAMCSDLKSKTPRTEISAFSGRD
jgi:hypothetical protein